jgi:hypothetical protein
MGFTTRVGNAIGVWMLGRCCRGRRIAPGKRDQSPCDAKQIGGMKRPRFFANPPIEIIDTFVQYTHCPDMA